MIAAARVFVIFVAFFLLDCRKKDYFCCKIIQTIKKSIISITIGLFLLLTGCAQNKTKMTTIYDFKALNNKGEEVDMEANIETMLK